MLLYKTVLGIFKIALRLRDQHVFMFQSLGILNVLSALILKYISEKLKLFLKNWSTIF